MPRRGKLLGISPYEGIRSRWEAASEAQFFKLFQHKFNFTCLSLRDLEEALLENESILLADTCARLLCFLTCNLNILIKNFEEHRLVAAKAPSNRESIETFLSTENCWG